MNLTVRESVKALQPYYDGLTDTQIIDEIRAGLNVGEALFYLLFGRYQDMLHTVFSQNSTAAIEFSDFMLELNMRLLSQELAALRRFDETKASLKTYLSKIAHNLLCDLRKKILPSIFYPEEILDPTSFDGLLVMQLIDAINSYADKDARYVLFKTIEGYRSKEIALMLSSKRHEDGTLDANETLKPSYIDTLRSRALRNIRREVSELRHEEYKLRREENEFRRKRPRLSMSEICESSTSLESISDEAICEDLSICLPSCQSEPSIPIPEFANPFIVNLYHLISELSL